MIKLHDQDQEFLNTCRALDNKIGLVIFFNARDPESKSDYHFLPALSEIQKVVAVRAGVDLTFMPVIGTIPNHTLRAGLKYALKIVSVDEELVKKIPAKTPAFFDQALNEGDGVYRP
jgi:pantothenate synthetase